MTTREDLEHYVASAIDQLNNLATHHDGIRTLMALVETLFRELEAERARHAWKVVDLETMIQNEHKLYADAMNQIEAERAAHAETERRLAAGLPVIGVPSSKR